MKILNHILMTDHKHAASKESRTDENEEEITEIKRKSYDAMHSN